MTDPDPRPSARIASTIRHRIATGQLRPRDHVSIGDSAREEGVSRPTAGKAMKALEAEGLIRRYEGYGWQVAE